MSELRWCDRPLSKSTSLPTVLSIYRLKLHPVYQPTRSRTVFEKGGTSASQNDGDDNLDEAEFEPGKKVKSLFFCRK